ncbi:MAG TPA: SDR family oxidoreductase [Acidiphilium sp.]|jgi:nucleoside-diphosphate-sugar epimerase|uniref:SDR family oxidoreductase n=1 Tax=unclassified Acidiphilium TaxID=2617493 RepID=UPI000BCE4B81|nr:MULTISPECIES: SDR family oxidoreductase [unclassified Acidiphilium]OYV55215.1 MAG: NAD-dependent dehydratase [Acidiphilium sp. 20-67-58]HQT61535.1 SDR family oxidoreductase [Acidiphilium sp.]HQU12542.1 SDR family oxidoreductase [Acidiphilium sp.]
MRVFVTGASGFIGTATTRELIGNGHEVLGLARSDDNAKALEALGAEVHRGSLEDLESLRKGAKETDGTIHLAFIHDFSKFAENGKIDKHAIDAMGDVLAGSDKPFIVTSGTLLVAPGRLATEQDAVMPGLPRVSEASGLALAARGVRAMAIRLPQVHGADGRCGLVNYLLNIAQEKGFSAYIGDGSNRWSGAHRLDVARLYRLALEKGRAGTSYHAVADEGVTARDIAEIIGRHLRLPVVSIPQEEAAAHFGVMAMFAGMDGAASSALTQQWLGWKPTQIGLIADISRPGYFDV